jgi:hypothetical protein
MVVADRFIPGSMCGIHLNIPDEKVPAVPEIQSMKTDMPVRVFERLSVSLAIWRDIAVRLRATTNLYHKFLPDLKKTGIYSIYLSVCHRNRK